MTVILPYRISTNERSVSHEPVRLDDALHHLFNEIKNRVPTGPVRVYISAIIQNGLEDLITLNVLAPGGTKLPDGTFTYSGRLLDPEITSVLLPSLAEHSEHKDPSSAPAKVKRRSAKKAKAKTRKSA